MFIARIGAGARREKELSKPGTQAKDPSIGIQARRRAHPPAGVRDGVHPAAGWLLALAAALLLAACSSIRFGYNYADTLLLFTLDRYFDLDEEQEQLARERVRNLLAWHRRTQLAGYAAFADEAQRALDAPVTADDILALGRSLNARLVAIGHQAAPDLAQLALSLQAAQVERFAGKLAEGNRKENRLLVRMGGTPTPEERVTRYVERAEDWFGPLDEAQVELIRQAIMRRPGGSDGWLVERERRQREMVGLLARIQRERPAVDTAARWLRDYFAELAEPTSPERRERAAAYRSANAEVLARLINSATPAQRAQAARKLRSYAEDFAVLASEGGSG